MESGDKFLHIGGESDARNANGLAAFRTLGEFLERDGWHPQALEGCTVYRSFFAGKNSDFHCFAQIVVNLEQFLFYVVAPVHVPEELRSSVAEFITRANFGLRIGNFEIDYSDGEVRYKTALDFEGETLTPAWIRNTIYPAVTTMDRYFPGLMKVIYGGRTPYEAIEEIERG